MNYALDALWWRLRDAAVRDLASLLTAPAPWHTGCELPVRRLLGDGGFRVLLALDEAPQPLYDYLAQGAPFARRLGVYAETLLAFWLTHAPHARLLARNFAVRGTHGDTLGAADFLAELDGETYHLELACKYYGGTAESAATFAGLCAADRLTDKAAKIMQQLALSQSEAFQAACRSAGVERACWRRASVVRGMIFVPENTALRALPAPVSASAWLGVRAARAVAARMDWPENSCFAEVERMARLAPLRLPENAVCGSEVWHGDAPGMVAVLQRRCDGFWHETARVMCVQAA